MDTDHQINNNQLTIHIDEMNKLFDDLNEKKRNDEEMSYIDSR